MTVTSGTPKEIARQMTNTCIAMRLRQLNRMVTRLYDEALRPLGFTVNQLNILATIISHGPIPPGQLGQMLGMEKSTVSRTIDRMYKHGWIDIGPGKDKRSQCLQATAKGRKLLTLAAPVWDELQANVLDATADNAGLLAAFGIGHPGMDHPPAGYPTPDSQTADSQTIDSQTIDSHKTDSQSLNSQTIDSHKTDRGSDADDFYRDQDATDFYT